MRPRLPTGQGSRQGSGQGRARRSGNAMVRLAAPLPLLLLAAAPVMAQGVVVAQGASGAAPGGAGGVTSVLLHQARYWRAHDRSDLARNALDRLLGIDPGNADALALLAQMQAAQGDQAAAEMTLRQLRQHQPDSQELSATERSIQIGSIDPAALATARSLAQQGRAADAVERYQALFHGTEPPDPLAVEYYQVLAATPTGWQAARDGLARQAQANPQDTRAQMALAELLTYREQTRADGISRLQELAGDPASSAPATRAWRQALQWLPTMQASIPAYQAYLAQHPDDNVIDARFEQARAPSSAPTDEAASSRGTGFDALKAGRLDEAEQQFAAALRLNPNDADALGGLGLVQLRRGNSAEAQALLKRAIAADPAHRDRWEPALSGASMGTDYAQARADIASGRLGEAATRLREIISHGGDTTGAHAMLADVAARQGKLEQAETEYRIVLRARPRDSGALIGLAQVLERQNRSAEADDLLSQAEADGHGAAVGRLRAARLREQADAAPDRTARLALLRAAQEADPEDPWIALDLARALQAAGEPGQAEAVMAALTQGRRTGVDALRAGAMFASETGHAAEANALIARLPRSARNAQMIAIRDKAAFAAQVQAALANGYGNPGAVRGRLLELAAHPDPDGSRGTAIATALLRSGDRDDIPTALSTALAATPQPTPAQRLSYAGLLMQAGRPSASRALVAPLDDAALMPDQRSALNSLRAGAAVQTSDALNNRGETADAYDQLAPALRRDPDNADLNLALGRLYQSASSPRRALAIDEAVLQRDPGNLTARRAAVEAAIQLGELDRAYTLTSEVMTTMPDEPGTWIIAATYQRSIGNDHRALQDLLTARNLRQQQIGVASADTPGQDAPPGQDDSALSPVASNPFRHSAAGQGAQEDFGLIVPSEPAGGAHPGPSGDAMSADIDTQIATLQDSLAPKAQIGAGLRSRSGSAGLDQLQEATVPLTGSFSPGRGRLTATATPTFLNGGDLDSSTASQIQFGTNALGGAKAPGNQTASGVGLDANWAYRWLTVDAGTSPLGFRESNLIGGVELAPALSSTLRLRLTGERRAVTDSVLSYAGTEDARTGQSWGGVTRTRGHAQLELSAAPATFYAGGGYASLQGDNVASNSEIELGAGGAYPFYHTATEDARIGLDLVYFAYDHNLRYFSFGQGGYFSPQSYFAALIPVEYRRKTDGLNWGVGASVGYQTYTEHASNVFPNDPALQAQLESAAAGDSTIPTQYGGKSASGVVGGAHGDVEYRVAPQLVVGSKAIYQRAGDWNEAQGLIYARYSFEGGQP